MADVLQFDVKARGAKCVACRRRIDTQRDRNYLVDTGRECARCYDQRVHGSSQGRITAGDGYMANTTPTL